MAAGIRKVNVGTALNLAGTAALRQVLAERPDAVDPRVYGRVVRQAMADTVARPLPGHLDYRGMNRPRVADRSI